METRRVVLDIVLITACLCSFFIVNAKQFVADVYSCVIKKINSFFHFYIKITIFLL